MADESGAAEIVDGTTARSPDLIIQVAGGGSSSGSSPGLLVFRGKDRQLLLSQAFVAPPGTTADLGTSVAIAARSAIGCGNDALASKPAMQLPDLKQYLRACERFNALYGIEDVSLVIPQLAQIVARYPHFTPAWKQLLLASAFVRSLSTDLPKPSQQWLQAKRDAAARIDQNMPELAIAELELLPVTDFARRLGLLDHAVAANPDDQFVLGARAEQLMAVGRVNDAVVDAERGARLYALSPYARSEYVRALAFSGRQARAFEELNALKPLPDLAMGLTDTRFRVNMRYGDPNIALKILRTYGTNKAHDAFLEARLRPSPQNVERAVDLAKTGAKARNSYGTLIEVLQIFGRTDEALGVLMTLPLGAADQSLLQTLFRPPTKGLREDMRFMRVAHRLGLVRYWRESGRWPDFCEEPGLKYDCKTEAAKLQ
jgi:tetratricopeptide (TPR) repeat protein